LEKRLENCDSCDVDDQPDPDAECELCVAQAVAEGRSIDISPETGQILKIRALIKSGYRFNPDDLLPWQWEALVEVDRAMEKHQAEQIKNAGKR